MSENNSSYPSEGKRNVAQLEKRCVSCDCYDLQIQPKEHNVKHVRRLL